MPQKNIKAVSLKKNASCRRCNIIEGYAIGTAVATAGDAGQIYISTTSLTMNKGWD